MEKEEIFIFVCSKCNKVIRSISKSQLDYNSKLHQESHKRKTQIMKGGIK